MASSSKGIEAIPEEILVQIFRHLDAPDVLNARRASSSVFHRSAPALYTSINLTLNSYRNRKPVLHALYTCLARSTELQHRVKSFCLRGGLPGDTSAARTSGDRILLSDLEWLDPTIYGLDRDVETSALLVKVLSLMPRLLFLDLGVKSMTDSPVLASFLVDKCQASQSSNLNGFWSGLRSVKLGCDLNEEGPKEGTWFVSREQAARFDYQSRDAVFAEWSADPRIFAAFLCLDSLEHFDALLPASMQGFVLQSPKQLPHLTSLSLLSTVCREDTVFNILSCTPRLKRFEYEYYWDPGNWFDPTLADKPPLRMPQPAALRKALELIRDTLEYLKLSMESYEYKSPFVMRRRHPLLYWPLDESIGTLKDFYRLRILEISPELLFDPKDPSKDEIDFVYPLPRNLVKLVMREEQPYIQQHRWTARDFGLFFYKDFLNGRVYKEIPSLKELHLKCRSGSDWDLDIDLEFNEDDSWKTYEPFDVYQSQYYDPSAHTQDQLPLGPEPPIHIEEAENRAELDHSDSENEEEQDEEEEDDQQVFGSFSHELRKACFTGGVSFTYNSFLPSRRYNLATGS